MRPTMRPGIWRRYSLAAGEEPQVGAAEAQRPAQALPLGDGDVGAVVAGRRQHAERYRVGGGDEEGAGGVGGAPQRAQTSSRQPKKFGLLDGQAGVLAW